MRPIGAAGSVCVKRVEELLAVGFVSIGDEVEPVVEGLLHPEALLAELMLEATSL